MFESLFLYATLFEYIVFLKYFCQTITSTKSHFFPDISPSHFKRFNLHQNGFIVPYDHKFNSLSHFPIEWWMYRWLDIGGLTTRKRFLPGTFRRALVSFPRTVHFSFFSDIFLFIWFLCVIKCRNCWPYPSCETMGAFEWGLSLSYTQFEFQFRSTCY